MCWSNHALRERAVPEAEPGLTRRGVSQAAARLCADVLRPHGYQTEKKAAKVSRVSGITFQSRARFYIDHTEMIYHSPNIVDFRSAGGYHTFSNTDTRF